IVPGSFGQTSISYFGLTATTQFRAVIQNGACPLAFSTPVVINVSQPTQGGVILGAIPSCNANASGVLQLTSHVGQIIRWETSTNNFLNVTTHANTTAFFIYSNLSATTQFR